MPIYYYDFLPYLYSMDFDYIKMATSLSQLSCDVHHKGVVITPIDDGVRWSDPCCDQFAETLTKHFESLIDKQLFGDESGSETF